MSAPMSPERQLRDVLSDAAANAVTEHADRIAAEVLAAVSNAVDDEVGYLRERIARQQQTIDNGEKVVVARDATIRSLRAELDARPTRASVLRDVAEELRVALARTVVGQSGDLDIVLSRLVDMAERAEQGETGGTR